MNQHEPLDNVFLTCAAHAAQPQAHLAARAPESYLGCYVKRAFPGRGADEGHVEHMWVQVQRVTPDGQLEGRLDNDPVFDVGYDCGDTIRVRLDMIEAVLENTDDDIG